MTAYWNGTGGAFYTVWGTHADGLAWGSYSDLVNTTGWAHLIVTVRVSPPSSHLRLLLVCHCRWTVAPTQGSPRIADDERKVRGMGYLEGRLSHERIYDAYFNIIHSSQPPSRHVILFASKQVRACALLLGSLSIRPNLCASAHQLDWMREQVTANPDSDYWKHVGLSLAQVCAAAADSYPSMLCMAQPTTHPPNQPSIQLEGMAAGYNDSPSPKLSMAQFYLLTNAGDLEDLVNLPPSPTQEEGGAEPIWNRAGKPMECSGLIKLTADGNSLFAGHTTFNQYPYMLRIFKHYIYNLGSVPTSAQTVSFSSRPGDLESKVIPHSHIVK